MAQERIERAETKYRIESNDIAAVLIGRQDSNLKAIEERLGVDIIARGDELTVIGLSEGVSKALSLLHDLQGLVKKGLYLTVRDVHNALDIIEKGEGIPFSKLAGDVIQVNGRGKQIRPKTIGQKRYVDAIRNNVIVFGIGPAGTGKTYLAMAMAISALTSKEVSKIVLTRPAVEAGEKLGFLPGDLYNKVDPYLRPLNDALYDILGPDILEKYREKGTIEIAPLAYMRGRTLDDSFIILDEAQNTTKEQMKMFLTRLGHGSKAVVTGDLTQIDLPRRRFSGLEHVRRILKDIKGIEFNYFTERDVIRHELVQKIIKAYQKYEEENIGG